MPSIGIFCVDLSAQNEGETLKIDLFPWKDAVWPFSMENVIDENLPEKIYSDSSFSQSTHFCLHTEITVNSNIPKLNKTITALDYITEFTESVGPHDILTNLLSDEFMLSLVRQLISILERAVEIRVFNQPDVNRKEFKTSIHQPQKEMLEGQKNIESISSEILCEGSPTSKCSCTPGDQDARPKETSLLKNNCVTEEKHKLDNDAKSLALGSDTTDSGSIVGSDTAQSRADGSLHDGTGTNDIILGAAAVAVLFSGGLDSAVIAALVDR